MPSSGLDFFPLALPFLLALFFLVGIVIVLVEVGVLRYAYKKMGISRQYVFSILLLSLLGSYVNIPVARLPAKRVVSGEEVSFFGMRYQVPVVERGAGTVIAVNLGGAVVPTLLSIYLVWKNRLYLRSLIAILIMAAIVHAVAQPVRGVGIAVPIFIPPLVAASLGLILSRGSAPALAYVGGSLGTLLGGDIMNLGRVQALGAPILSIGGAGTFDGIFLTGILAVLLA